MKTLKFFTVICLVLVCLSIFAQPRIAIKYRKGGNKIVIVTTRKDTISERTEFTIKETKAHKEAIKESKRYQKAMIDTACDREIAFCDSIIANAIRLGVIE